MNDRALRLWNIQRLTDAKAFYTMSRKGFRGPRLPHALLDQIGGVSKGHRRETTRKERRKAERTQRKAALSKKFSQVRRFESAVQKVEVKENEGDLDDATDEWSSHEGNPMPRQPAKNAQPLHSILKDSKKSKMRANSEDGSENPEDGEESDGSFTISRHAAKAGMADEDAEIAALEKKLGIKDKRKSMGFGDDELEWLVTGSDSEEDERILKRKRPEDMNWLREKRLKAAGTIIEKRRKAPEDASSTKSHLDDESLPSIENPFSDDELSEEDLGGFESSEEDSVPLHSTKKVRENPYAAPIVKAEADASVKYIPPSLRKPAETDEETLKQLRRKVQGQLNRLSEANLLSILHSIEQTYQENARQHVTLTLVDLLVGLISDPSTLNDTFIILHSAFTAALYKVIGTDFGAQLLERIVETVDQCRGGSMEGKQMLNLIAFLSNLYNFQVVSSGVIFDYIRILLGELSESNTELLLRLIRTCGTKLRQDDPTTLKDIVLLLHRNVMQVGEANLSVRTKFMIETINNLKNNRMKSNAASVSALAAEHTARMRKILGSMSSARSTIRATEPLRVTLSDLKSSEKKGKWWLVGASYLDPAKITPSSASSPSDKLVNQAKDNEDAGYESETPGKPNLHRLARQQGMNTDIRRAIFISILSALDYQDAYAKLMKLSLNKKQQPEIVRVLVHCAGAEGKWNPYYALLARKIANVDKKLRKAFHFQLLDVLRVMDDDCNMDDDLEIMASQIKGTGDHMTTQRIVNLGKLYGELIADQTLPVSVLKTIEFATLQLSKTQAKVKAFVDVCLTTVMLKSNKVTEVFQHAVDCQRMVKGLMYYIESEVSKAELANGKKEIKAIKKNCEDALRTLAEATDSSGGVLEERDDEESD